MSRFQLIKSSEPNAFLDRIVESLCRQNMSATTTWCHFNPYLVGCFTALSLIDPNMTPWEELAEDPWSWWFLHRLYFYLYFALDSDWLYLYLYLYTWSWWFFHGWRFPNAANTLTLVNIALHCIDWVKIARRVEDDLLCNCAIGFWSQLQNCRNAHWTDDDPLCIALLHFGQSITVQYILARAQKLHSYTDDDLVCNRAICILHRVNK